MRTHLLLVILALLSGVPTLANFAPVYAKDKAKVSGAIEPLKSTAISLKSEDLKITLLDDGDHYLLEGRYDLINAGDTATLQIGYPIEWMVCDYEGAEVSPGCEIHKEPSAEARELAKSLAIEINGKTQSCTVQPGARVYAAGLFYVRSWCTLPLSFGRGEKKVLRFSYRGTMSFEDEFSFSADKLTKSQRLFTYPFFPAARFSGTVDSLRITLDPGKHRDALIPLTVFTSEEIKKKDGQIVKVLKNVDFTKLPVLEFKVLPPK